MKNRLYLFDVDLLLRGDPKKTNLSPSKEYTSLSAVPISIKRFLPKKKSPLRKRSAEPLTAEFHLGPMRYRVSDTTT
jgi:hypothetical protein